MKSDYLNITPCYRPDAIIVLGLSGAFKPDDDPEGMEILSKYIDESRFLILNLRDLQVLDPKSGLAKLLLIGKDLFSRGGVMVLAGTIGQVHSTLEGVGFFHLVNSAESTEKAVAQIQNTSQYQNRFSELIQVY